MVMSQNGTTTKPISNGSSHKEHSSRQSPPPLAPLHYLQNQRRGSITDPSLHVAHNLKLNSTSYRDQLPSTSSTHHELGSRSNISDPRPNSPYIFGDATSHLADNSPQIRNLLRSPSIEKSSYHSSQEGSQSSTDVDHQKAGLSRTNNVEDMNVDELGVGHRPLQHFDYNMRRHSIAVGQDQTNHGTKRKMSSDRSGFAPVGEEIDPQLVGPGVPSVVATELDNDNHDNHEGPATKRRGSAIDTQRIAQLSLNDRRNSVDSRGSGQWWLKDSTSSVFSNYGPGFTGGEPAHGRVLPANSIATFSWPLSTDQSGPATETDHLHRSFDPTNQMNIIPPLNFTQDRRMSVPDTLISTRSLRSRSRPPSRQTPNADSSPQALDDSPSAPSPTGSGKRGDSTTTTPYSRSPELRVSHKLAERKRRKEMKDLFDELRDQLPADRGMKASKWEILSKAIDFVAQLKQSHQDMAREIEILRHELEATRQGIPFGPGVPPHAIVYAQPPVPVPGQFPPPPPSAISHQPTLSHPPTSRPGSSQNTVTPSGPHPGPPPQNGNIIRTEPPPT